MKSPDEVPDLNVMTTTLALTLVGTAVSSAAPAPAQTQLRSEMLVSSSWLQEHLADRDLVVLCVGRTRGDYDAGHIPGARFLPLDEIVEQHADSLNDLPPAATLPAVFESLGVGDNSRVILYDDEGGLLAARAYFTLDYLGHAERAALLDGGMQGWKSESGPIDHKPVHPAPAKFTPQVDSELLITTARIRQITTAPESATSQDYVLLDARSPREFDGSVMSEAVPKAGHLAGALSLYWKTLLQSDAAPSLKDTADLRRAFVDAGAAPGKLLVTYCRTGMQSSFTYFVAKYLGYRAAMYDGSVYEWVNRAGFDLVVSTAERH